MNWEISKDLEGTTLYEFLKKHIKNTSNRQIKKWIDEGKCSLNGKVVLQGNIVLFEGDSLECFYDISPLSVFEKNRILFENDDFLAYNKPSGMICDAKGVAPIRVYHSDLELIHRLDRYTTGVLLLAKSAKVKQRFISLFRERMVKKTYLALVEGKVRKSQGKICNHLGKVGESGGKAVWGAVERGSEAETHWKTLAAGASFSLLEARPITGRTHQIRTHFSGIGHPIVGDHLYGSSYMSSHYWLHASQVIVESYKISAPIPDEFRYMISALKIPFSL